MRLNYVCIFFLFSVVLNAQVEKIEGKVFDEFLESFYGAVVETNTGKKVTTNSKGVFVIKGELPITINVSASGYTTEKIEINSLDNVLNIILKESVSFDQVVFSASRAPEKLFEAPVAIKKFGMHQADASPANNYFGSLGYLEGVNVYNNSKLTQVINTRGFSDLCSKRYVQLVDGVDTYVPALGMSSANAIGINDLDVEYVELTPGAASALYGANAFNGLIQVQTKSPFAYSGVTTELKGGITNQETGNYGFSELGTRLAYAFDSYFAAKVCFSKSDGQEWDVNDYRNVDNDFVKNKRTQNYNGVNIYGDKKLSFKDYAYSQFLLNPSGENYRAVNGFSNQVVDRTGYKEMDLIPRGYGDRKLSLALHYRPFGDEDVELMYKYNFTNLSTVFHSAPARYRLENAEFRVHSLELKTTNYFLRAYHSKANIDKKYNQLLIARLLSKSGSTDKDWIKMYSSNFGKFRKDGNSIAKSHELTRAITDRDRLVPNTLGFNQKLNSLINTNKKDGGGNIVDYSGFSHVDGNYNFSEFSDLVDVQVGFSYRDFVLDSNGTLFTDYDKPIHYSEYGVYSQFSKKLFDDRFKFTTSLRYDGASNSKPNFSPRISGVYSFGKVNNHNIRFTVQTAFRSPSCQNQYAAIKTGKQSFVIGNTTENKTRFNGMVYDPITEIDVPINKIITNYGFESLSFNSYRSKVFNGLKEDDGVEQIFREANKRANLNGIEVGRFDEGLGQEKLQSLELGYRGLFYVLNSTVELDLTTYINRYDDFISDKTYYIPTVDGVKVNVPKQSRGIEDVNPNQIKDPFTKAVASVLKNQYAKVTMPVNLHVPILSYGAIFATKAKLFNNVDLNFSYSYMDYSYDKNNDIHFRPGFNTPNHTFKFMLGDKSLFKRFGYNLAFRWQSAYDWDSEFLHGKIESLALLDFQFNYRIPVLRSTVKIAVNNAFGKGYYAGLGSGKIGRTMFVSWIIN